MVDDEREAGSETAMVATARSATIFVGCVAAAKKKTNQIETRNRLPATWLDSIVHIAHNQSICAYMCAVEVYNYA